MYINDPTPQSGPWSVQNILEPSFDAAASRPEFHAHTLLIEVDDVPGVLNEVTGVIARRGYNVQSLAVGNSETAGRSRITTVVPGQLGSIGKLIKQIEKLIVVISVTDLTNVPHVSRELMLVKARRRPCSSLSHSCPRAALPGPHSPLSDLPRPCICV